MTDLMIDIETLSLDPQKAYILSICVVRFPRHGPVGYINHSCQFRTSPEFLASVDREAVKWWMRQAAAAREGLDYGQHLPLSSALQEVAKEINKDETEFVWARGPQFDLSNIWHQAQIAGIQLTKSPYCWRDSRSLAMVLGNTHYRAFVENYRESRAYVPHIASDDALVEAAFVQHVHLLKA